MQYPHPARPSARSPRTSAARVWAGRVAWTGFRAPPSLDCMVSQDFLVRSGAASATAPLDRGELELSLRPFGESRMLPRAAYVDPAVFAWEQRHFFGGG